MRGDFDSPRVFLPTNEVGTRLPWFPDYIITSVERHLICMRISVVVPSLDDDSRDDH